LLNREKARQIKLDGTNPIRHRTPRNQRCSFMASSRYNQESARCLRLLSFLRAQMHLLQLRAGSLSSCPRRALSRGPPSRNPRARPAMAAGNRVTRRRHSQLAPIGRLRVSPSLHCACRCLSSKSPVCDEKSVARRRSGRMIMWAVQVCGPASGTSPARSLSFRFDRFE
jgi:hypothetical protein